MSQQAITVLEHEFLPIVDSTESVVGITEGDAEALMRLNEMRRGFCQRVHGGVRLAQYCGVVRLPHCVLEVLPKIGTKDPEAGEEERARGAFITMLRHARQLRITSVGEAPQRIIRAPLLDVFIAAFLSCAMEQARRGLLSRYESLADDLPVIKGRFVPQVHIRRNVSRPHLLFCEHDEFTADNPYNRAIKATLDVTRGWIQGASTQRLWLETYTRFTSITSIRMSPDHVAKLPRDRTTKRYDAVLTWCEWLLAMASPSLRAGALHAPGLLFDMNKLFESYVGHWETLQASDEVEVQSQGPIEALAKYGKDVEAFPLKPDFTIWRTGPDLDRGAIERVVDAKWKRLDPFAADWGVDQADIYQLLAYGLHYRCPNLELAYPMPDYVMTEGKPPTFQVAGADSNALTIQIKLVPLWN